MMSNQAKRALKSIYKAEGSGRLLSESEIAAMPELLRHGLVQINGDHLAIADRYLNHCA